MNQNPKILLIQPPSNCVNDDRVEPPLGLLYIASTLKEYGYKNISVYDMTGCKNETEISAKINNIPESNVYAISCFCTNYKYVKRTIGIIKKNNSSTYIAIGGPNATGIPEFTYKDSGADVVVVGEGEDIFTNSVDAFVSGSNLTGILNGNGREDINSYAFPARDLVDLTTYSRKLMGEPVISLLSSRGCIHHCIHCNSVVMGGGNRNVRYRSSDNIIQEIKSFRDRFKYYRFNDDHFTGNPNLEELLIRMKELDGIFRNFARIEDLDDKKSRLLKEAGCIHVSIGLESLYPNNLKLLGKPTQIGKEGNVRIAKAHGLVIRASFMVGLPYDTDKTINNSFQKAAKLGLDEFSIYPLIPYPGTEIWKNPEKFGYKIVHQDFTDYVQIGKDGRTCFALEHENFGPDDVRRWLQIATEILKARGAKHMSESKVAE